MWLLQLLGSFMTIASAMTITVITANLVSKAIRPIISNKATHTYVASSMTITDIIGITVITTSMTIIFLTSIISIITNYMKVTTLNKFKPLNYFRLKTFQGKF